MKNGHTKAVIGAVIVLLGLIASAAAVVLPEWNEYNNVVEAMRATVADPSLKEDSSVAQVRAAYASRVSGSDITKVSPQDLEITKENGRLVISAVYRTKLPMLGEMSWPATSRDSN